MDERYTDPFDVAISSIKRNGDLNLVKAFILEKHKLDLNHKK